MWRSFLLRLYLSLRAQTALGDPLRVELNGVIGEVEPVPAPHAMGNAGVSTRRLGASGMERYS